jgi:hypothetical protein
VGTLASLGTFWQQLQTMGLGNQISLATLNVFGRTLAASTSTNGRGHNENHHVMVMIGEPFAGSVIGGVELAANQGLGSDYAAMTIDQASGAGVPDGKGNVPFGSTLQSAAMTLAAGLGVSQSYLTQNITGGSVINAALS